METKKEYTIAIDLSGANLKVCIFKDNRPEFIDMVKEELDIYAHDHEYIERRVKTLVDDILVRVGIGIENCDAIGISSPGTEAEGKAVGDPKNNLFYLKEYIEQHYHVDAYIENDANMSALGEYAFGAGKHANSMVFLLLGNTVGAGVVINGKLYKGANGQAGEVGQMIIDEDGISDWYRCPVCPNKGCVDSMASETAIVVLAKDALRKGEKIGALTFEDIPEIKAGTIIQAAMGGDTVALRIIQQVATNISIVVYNIIVTLDPDILVVGGRLSKYFDFLFPMIAQYLESKHVRLKQAQTKVVKNQIAGDAGLLGALVIKGN